jgi:hypothetical protein
MSIDNFIKNGILIKQDSEFQKEVLSWLSKNQKK